MSSRPMRKRLRRMFETGRFPGPTTSSNYGASTTLTLDEMKKAIETIKANAIQPDENGFFRFPIARRDWVILDDILGPETGEQQARRRVLTNDWWREVRLDCQRSKLLGVLASRVNEGT